MTTSLSSSLTERLQSAPSASWHVEPVTSAEDLLPATIDASAVNRLPRELGPSLTARQPSWRAPPQQAEPSRAGSLAVCAQRLVHLLAGPAPPARRDARW